MSPLERARSWRRCDDATTTNKTHCDVLTCDILGQFASPLMIHLHTSEYAHCYASQPAYVVQSNAGFLVCCLNYRWVCWQIESPRMCSFFSADWTVYSPAGRLAVYYAKCNVYTCSYFKYDTHTLELDTFQNTQSHIHIIPAFIVN